MNLYFISGLGADKRVFQKLNIGWPFVVHHVEWVPVAPDEALSAYCEKLIKQINQEEPFILIGLSFGGVIAIELSKKIKPVQTVLISSVSSPGEVGRFYIALGKLKLQQHFPIRFLLKPSRLLFYLFGAHTEAEKKLMRDILMDTDPVFFRWSIDQMFSWKNSWKPEKMLHIHGTNDKILPYNPRMQAIPVLHGEHLMVYSKSAEISLLLEEHLLRG